jgi:hypothetical protein
MPLIFTEKCAEKFTVAAALGPAIVEGNGAAVQGLLGSPYPGWTDHWHALVVATLAPAPPL